MDGKKNFAFEGKMLLIHARYLFVLLITSRKMKGEKFSPLMKRKKQRGKRNKKKEIYMQVVKILRQKVFCLKLFPFFSVAAKSRRQSFESLQD
jgi:uncharacterized membrane protein